MMAEGHHRLAGAAVRLDGAVERGVSDPERLTDLFHQELPDSRVLRAMSPQTARHRHAQEEHVLVVVADHHARAQGQGRAAGSRTASFSATLGASCQTWQGSVSGSVTVTGSVSGLPPPMPVAMLGASPKVTSAQPSCPAISGT